MQLLKRTQRRSTWQAQQATGGGRQGEQRTAHETGEQRTAHETGEQRTAHETGAQQGAACSAAKAWEANASARSRIAHAVSIAIFWADGRRAVIACHAAHHGVKQVSGHTIGIASPQATYLTTPGRRSMCRRVYKHRARILQHACNLSSRYSFALAICKVRYAVVSEIVAHAWATRRWHGNKRCSGCHVLAALLGSPTCSCGITHPGSQMHEE